MDSPPKQYYDAGYQDSLDHQYTQHYQQYANQNDEEDLYNKVLNSNI